jgi:cytochrome b-561 domain containing protein 2
MGFGLLCIILGTSAIITNKNIHYSDHFVSTHAVNKFSEMNNPKRVKAVLQKLGLLAFVWIIFQTLIGAASVWFDGRLFGGGMRAKRIWKYHRLVLLHPTTPSGY